MQDLTNESTETQKNQPRMSRMTKQAQNKHFEPLRHVFLISTDHIINDEYNWNQRKKKLRKCIDFQSKKLATKK